MAEASQQDQQLVKGFLTIRAAKKKRAWKRRWVEFDVERRVLRYSKKEDSKVGPHNVGCANESFVPPGVPQRWADLAPLLMLRFRKFTPAERKQELHRALGHAGSTFSPVMVVVTSVGDSSSVGPSTVVFFGPPHGALDASEYEVNFLLEDE